ncbi:DUF5819 family protein [Streptomyces sp. NPDC051207]|uniref:DUF5819 family protein n=1 Tax=Streptomyces sp. NPDC051207 TaxID=3154641 RepID=UPI003424AB0F
MDAYDRGSGDRHGTDSPASPAPPPAPASDSVGPADSPGAVAGPEGRVAGPEGGAPAASADPPPAEPPPTDITALSPRYQTGVALALAVVAAAVCVHLGMSFLHVAPANTVTKQHGQAIDDWIYPEFEQNWKLFAPNPLQQNIAVQVRAEVRTGGGGTRTTGWYDLSAQDGRAIDGNLLPSHTQQNELRRAWDFFTATHDSDNRPVGLRGALSESYLRRIVVLRLDRAGVAGPGGTVERVQVRSRTTNVPPPEWTRERVSDKPTYRVLPWWPVSAESDTVDAAAGGTGTVSGGDSVDVFAAAEGSAR